METCNKRAIFVSDSGFIESVLFYNEVYDFSENISTFLSKFITERNHCLILNMSHNIYIPSIILSLQKLHHCFIFVPDNSELEAVTEKLVVRWILSISKTKSPNSLQLKNDNLNLTETSHREFKTYKDIFYIIRTSGTTGESKFVQVSNYSIESNINSLSTIFNIQQSDVIYFGTPLTFDPSMIELLIALRNKACLLISKQQLNPVKLHQTLFHFMNGITVLQIVPSLFLRWSSQQLRDILLNEKLKILAFGGESFPQSVLNYSRSANLRIFNLYGITELSVWATIYEVTEDSNDVSLGVPLDDTIVEIRNASRNKIEIGEGEIFVGSKTRKCLINDDISDNEAIIFRATGDIAEINKKGIYYKGRSNNSFKRLGHKIHLDKIEEIVEKETGLVNKTVWLKDEAKLLLFLIVEKLDGNLKEKILDKIRVKLLHSLPRHCNPDFIDIIPKCPITSHGKTNRKILQEIYHNRKENSKELFSSLLCKYLGLSATSDQVLNSSFFELGGNSILAVQFLNEFKDETGADSQPLVKAMFEGNLKDCLAAVGSAKIGRKRPQFSETESKFRKLRNIEAKVKWKYNLEACVDSTPLIFQHEGRTLIAVGSFSHIFVVLDACDGTEIAKYILPDVIEASPTLSLCGNFLYIGCFDGNLYCLHFSTNTIKWSYSTAERIKSRPILGQNSIIFGSYDKHLHSIKPDGSLIWKTLVDESISANVVINKEKIFIGTICGTCLCLLEATGQVLWRFRTSRPIFGSPVIINDNIAYPIVHGSLLILTPNGEKIRQFDCSGHLYHPVLVHDGSIIFGTKIGSLYVIELKNESKMRKLADLQDGLTTPCILNNKLIVAGNSGHVFFVDFNGNVEGDLSLPNQIFSSVVVTDKCIFVGCRDNNLYCIETQ